MKLQDRGCLAVWSEESFPSLLLVSLKRNERGRGDHCLPHDWAATPTIPVTVPVTGVPSTMDSGTIPRSTAVHVFYTPRGPWHHDGVLYQQSKMYQRSQLQWGHFNPESTEETYILTHGPQRDSRFNMGLYEDPGYPLYRATEEVTGCMWISDRTRECSDRRLMEEGYEVDARVKVLERGQQEIKRDLEK
ncbi:UNVERIFIED_CONTAM: hypothetical protein K2H54_048906 [Gekko kuhli]